MFSLTVSDVDHVRPRFNYIWEGQTLYALLDGQTSDGSVPTGTVYEWTVGGRVVQTASAMYTTTAADAGSSISVRALVQDGGQTVSVTASGAMPVLDAVMPAASWLDVATSSSGYVNSPGTLTVGGTIATGQVLHASVQDTDGASNIHYAWDIADSKGNWSTVSGATSADFSVGAATPAVVRVFADYVDNHGALESPVTTLGTNGADTIYTSWDQEHVYAGAGDDIIHSSITRHVVDGGAGVDTYVIDSDSYSVSHDVSATNTWTVSLGFGVGVATLVNVERVKTPTGMLALDVDGNAGQMFRLYQAAFNRVPDLEGLGFWIKAMDNGQSLNGVAKEFVASAEFKTLYGTSPSNTALLTAIYANVLHREPDAEGYKFWLNVLDTHQDTLAGVLTGFSESAENQAALVGVMQHGIQYIPYAG